MAEHARGIMRPSCLLPLASLPDGALAIVMSFISVDEILVCNSVCQDWLISGDRLDLWKAIGENFEVMMPTSLGPQRDYVGRIGGGKRVLRLVICGRVSCGR